MCARPRPRTPSTKDGTCSASAEPATTIACTPVPATRRAIAATSRRGLRLGTLQPRLLEQLAERTFDARFTLARGELARLRPRHDHEIVAVGKILGHRPERFPHQALYAVPLYRSTNLAPHRQAQARQLLVRLAWERVQHEVAVRV